MQDPDPDPYLWLVDPDPDPGGPKTCGSGFGSGSATLYFTQIQFCNIKFFPLSINTCSASLEPPVFTEDPGIKPRTVSIQCLHWPVKQSNVYDCGDVVTVEWVTRCSVAKELGWEWLERLTANAHVATVLGSIPASVGTVESEGRQMKQCWI